MLIIIDNYDSFTYNLVQYCGQLGYEPYVFRNDEKTAEDILRWNPSEMIISPGPGRPESAGISIELIRLSSGKVPLLGVCLGHQAIGVAFGATVVRAKRVMHGKCSRVWHDGKTIFFGISNPFIAMRYHSLVVDPSTLNGSFLEVSAWTEEGEIMGLRHKERQLCEGIQFHPESIGTPEGMMIMSNFFSLAKKLNS
jgi:anthranilate synthase/aminodeoxychorismate synthase-like glutamine amidotransferase